MVITRKYIPRRTFLRGAGAALALPLLDSMTPALALEAKRPIRMSFIEVPNGIMNLNGEWTPKTVGGDFELTQTLQPLASFRDRMLELRRFGGHSMICICANRWRCPDAELSCTLSPRIQRRGGSLGPQWR